jgi:peptidoglycan L-alanyl-D-glutamate endopeptidase CwlK
LQIALKAKGFSTGVVDGHFGPATEAGVMGFQRSNGLLPDGIVGPLTWKALVPDVDISRADATTKVTVDTVAAMFPMTSIRPIARHLPTILKALRDAGVIEKPLVLAALATVRAESEGFEPVEERISRYNTSPDGHPFDLYDHRADLGNLGVPDGARYKGRGFIQLTGRDNYRHFGKILGLDNGLVARPERANNPIVAARLLASFIASRAMPIKDAVLNGDLPRVRRLVNGGHHGLDRFTEAYRIGDRLIPDEVWASPVNC